MKFNDIRVIPWPRKGWRIQWSVKDMNPAHKFAIERSSAPEGPWSYVIELDAADYTYQDNEVPLQDLFSGFYYRIRVIDESEEDVVITRAVSTFSAGNLITQEIIRNHEILLEGMNGHPGYFVRHLACYKRTIAGTQCHFCINPVTGEQQKDNCHVCQNTGYIENWSNPIIFYGRWTDQVQKMKQITSTIDQEQEIRQLWTAAYPVIEPGDILAEKGTGKRYRVTNIATREPDGIIISQSASCKVLNREFIENELNFPGEEI